MDKLTTKEKDYVIMQTLSWAIMSDQYVMPEDFLIELQSYDDWRLAAAYFATKQVYIDHLEKVASEKNGGYHAVL